MSIPEKYDKKAAAWKPTLPPDEPSEWEKELEADAKAGLITTTEMGPDGNMHAIDFANGDYD